MLFRAAMNSAFSEDILAGKLAKLNNTQQCIESILSLLFSVHNFGFWSVCGAFKEFWKNLQPARVVSRFLYD